MHVYPESCKEGRRKKLKNPSQDSRCALSEILNRDIQNTILPRYRYTILLGGIDFKTDDGDTICLRNLLFFSSTRMRPIAFIRKKMVNTMEKLRFH